MTVISEFRRQRQEDQEFKVMLGYIGSMKPVWATDVVSNNINR